MALRACDISTSPLTVILDTGDYVSRFPLKEIWVKDVGSAEFIIYGSYDGSDGSWRQIDELTVPHGQRDNNHKSLLCGYRFIKVSTESQTESEIEIVAGGMS